MPRNVAPVNEDQIHDLVHWAAAENNSIAIQGAGTKSGFGYKIETDIVLSMQQYTGIIEYEPAELVMTAKSGTPVAEINKELAEHRQYLAFEPPCLSKIYSQESNSGTIGGVFMGNLSGPRRFITGAARDHILGIQAVNGRGEIYKSGGKVIKNVTGYDMSKLLTGSWGTLSILTEVSFKVLPLPETSNTIGVWGQSPDMAYKLMQTLAQSAYTVTGLAFLPGRIISKLNLDHILERNDNLTLIRLEGSALSIYEQIKMIESGVLRDVPRMIYATDDSVELWDAIRDIAPFQDINHSPVIMKLSIPPVCMLDLIRVIEQIGGCEWYADAAGSWLWIGICHGSPEDKINTIRREVSSNTGSALLYRASEFIKRATGIYSPPSSSMAALSRRIKQSFDPKNILNPGRLY